VRRERCAGTRSVQNRLLPAVYDNDAKTRPVRPTAKEGRSYRFVQSTSGMSATTPNAQRSPRAEPGGVRAVSGSSGCGVLAEMDRDGLVFVVEHGDEFKPCTEGFGRRSRGSFSRVQAERLHLRRVGRSRLRRVRTFRRVVLDLPSALVRHDFDDVGVACLLVRLVGLNSARVDDLRGLLPWHRAALATIADAWGDRSSVAFRLPSSKACPVPRSGVYPPDGRDCAFV
jgi:hypothetical protein